jgi:hypothetical protein
MWFQVMRKTRLNSCCSEQLSKWTTRQKNYLSLIDQLTRETEVRDSGINTVAVAHLAKTGEEATRKWL